VHEPAVGVGAEVGRSVADYVAGGEDAREGFFFNADPGEGLIVLERYVVVRAVLLNEVVLEQEGVLFGLHDDVTDVGDPAHQHLHLAAHGVDLGEVGAYPLLQVLGLPHVNDPVLLVEILIHSRLLREVFHDGFEVREVLVQGVRHMNAVDDLSPKGDLKVPEKVKHASEVLCGHSVKLCVTGI